MRLALNDQQEEPLLFIDVVTFGSSAEACAESLSQGRALAIAGRLISCEWLADDGTRCSKHTVVGRVQFGGRHNGDQPTNGEEPTSNEQDAF